MVVVLSENVLPSAMACARTHDAVAELLPPPRGGSVLDAGAGEGAFSRRLKDAGYEVLAMGYRPEQFRLPDVPFLQCDLDAPLSIASGSIDGIVAIEVIEHLESPALFLREASRCLRLGGWLVVTTPNVDGLASKLSMVIRGYPIYFGPSDYRKNGHISPTPYFQLQRLADRAGLEVEIRTYNVGKLPIPKVRHVLPLNNKRFRTRAWGESLIVRMRKIGTPAIDFERG